MKSRAPYEPGDKLRRAICIELAEHQLERARADGQHVRDPNAFLRSIYTRKLQVDDEQLLAEFARLAGYQAASPSSSGEAASDRYARLRRDPAVAAQLDVIAAENTQEARERDKAEREALPSDPAWAMVLGAVGSLPASSDLRTAVRDPEFVPWAETRSDEARDYLFSLIPDEIVSDLAARRRKSKSFGEFLAGSIIRTPDDAPPPAAEPAPAPLVDDLEDDDAA